MSTDPRGLALDGGQPEEIGQYTYTGGGGVCLWDAVSGCEGYMSMLINLFIIHTYTTRNEVIFSRSVFGTCLFVVVIWGYKKPYATFTHPVTLILPRPSFLTYNHVYTYTHNHIHETSAQRAGLTPPPWDGDTFYRPTACPPAGHIRDILGYIRDTLGT